MGISAGAMSLGTGLQAAGAVTSAIGSYSQAQGQRSALAYQASIADFNAHIAQGQASDAIRNGQTAEENQDLKTGQVMGTQRATLAANGVDLGSGNANEILSTTALMGKRDANQIHDNAMLQAWGYRTQAASYLQNETELNSLRDGIHPLMSGVSSLLTGATQVASGWDKTAKVNGTPDFSSTVKGKWSSLWGS